MHKVLIYILLLAPGLANAQTVDDWGVNDFTDNNVALGSRPLRETIGGIINIILGFLGILLTVAIIWGGINMMTSYGNAEKNEKGRGAVVAGAIGLILVLTAYAISRFVLSELGSQTI